MAGAWLVKTEPGDYAYDDLERDGETLWDGVRNPAARKHLAAMAPGDRVLIYHTGREKRVVGTARVVRGGSADDVVLAAERRLPRPVSLAELRQDRRLQDFDLLRLPRLSVMPITPAQWKGVMEHARRAEPAPGRRRQGHN